MFFVIVLKSCGALFWQISWLLGIISELPGNYATLELLVIDLETGFRVNRKLYTADIVSNHNSYLILQCEIPRSCTHKLLCNFRSCITSYVHTCTNSLLWTPSTTFTFTKVIISIERNNTNSCICTLFIVNDNVHPILTNTQCCVILIYINQTGHILNKSNEYNEWEKKRVSRKMTDLWKLFKLTNNTMSHSMYSV